MSAHANDHFTGFAQQFADAAQCANRVALETAEGVFGVQLRTLEQNVSATTGFFNAMAQANDDASYQALLPKGLQLARDNVERAASAGQQMVGLGLKGSEAISELVRQPFAAEGHTGR